MNRIIKHKSIISFVLVFFLSFSIFTDYKQKEVEAFAVVDDVTILILGLTVLATGYVAVNKDQVRDMGNRVFKQLEENAEFSLDASFYLADLAKNGAVKINETLIDAIKSVAESIPDTQVKNIVPGEISSSYTLEPSYIPEVYEGNYTIDKFYNASNFFQEYRVVANNDKSYLTVGYTEGHRFYNINLDKGKEFYFKLSSLGPYDWDKDETYRTYIWTPNPNISSGFNWIGLASSKFPLNLNVTFSGDVSVISANSIVTIPYDNAKIKENYNPTLINQRFDDLIKNGTVSIDRDSVISSNVLDRVISPDDVLSWDHVKDNVITGTGTDTDTDTGTGTGVWDWLKALLDAILDAIKAIGTFLSGLVDALISALLSLLEFLFVPSDTFIADKVMQLKSNFGSKLPYEQYTSIFNSNYDEEGIRDLMINWKGQQIVIVRFTLYNRFREVANFLIYAFMFFLLAIYNYSQIYKLIRGSNYVSATNTIGEFKGQFFGGGEVKK